MLETTYQPEHGMSPMRDDETSEEENLSEECDMLGPRHSKLISSSSGSGSSPAICAMLNHEYYGSSSEACPDASLVQINKASAKVTTAGGKQFLNNAWDGPAKNGSKAMAVDMMGSAAVDTQLTDKHKCFLKTKGSNFKEYVLNISNGAIVFSRPKSAKQ